MPARRRLGGIDRPDRYLDALVAAMSEERIVRMSFQRPAGRGIFGHHRAETFLRAASRAIYVLNYALEHIANDDPAGRCGYGFVAL